MLGLTKKSNYGVTALLFLVRHHNRDLVQIKEISDRCDISKNYLEQLFNRLKRHRIIDSIRGNRGGYKLARDPSEISLLTVLEALEGELNICPDNSVAVLERICRNLERDIKGQLNITLAELDTIQQSMGQPLFFYI